MQSPPCLGRLLPQRRRTFWVPPVLDLPLRGPRRWITDATDSGSRLIRRSRPVRRRSEAVTQCGRSIGRRRPSPTRRRGPDAAGRAQGPDARSRSCTTATAAPPTRSPTGSSGDRGTAEDVTQEAFLSLWRSGARYDRARGSVRTWLLGVVRNRAIDVLRREATRAPTVSLELERLPDQGPHAELTDAEALRHEAAREVRGALSEAARRPAQGDRARLLRRAQPFRDRRGAWYAARHGQGPHETCDGEDRGNARGGSVMRADDASALRGRARRLPARRARAGEEARAFERHLARLRALPGERERWLRASVDVLPSSVEQLEPPPALARAPDRRPCAQEAGVPHGRRARRARAAGTRPARLVRVARAAARGRAGRRW